MPYPTPRSRASLLLVALLILVATPACVALRAPLTPPERGGPPWMEITSAHFVLKTDVDRSTARRISRELEQSHAALAFALRQPTSTSDNRVEVVVFERRRDFKEASKGMSAAAFFSAERAADFEPRPMIVMPDSEVVEETRLLVQHELTHRLVHERFGDVPRWLDEGLAEYYAPLRVEGDRVIIGSATSIDFSERPHTWLARKDGFEQLEIPLHRAPTLRALVEAGRDEFYPSNGSGPLSNQQQERQAALYAGAWRLVHLLMNGPVPAYRDRFVAFLDDLQRGERPRDAFLERFGADWKGLEQTYRDYLSVQGLQLRIALAPPFAPSPPRERELGASEVHLLWARVLPWTPDNLPLAERMLEAAHAADAASLEVRLARARLFLQKKDLAAAKAQLDAALAGAPEDPRALFAHVIWEDQRRRAPGGSMPSPATPVDDALRSRFARRATTAAQLDAVAWDHLRNGRVDEGLGFSARARRADPLCWSCQDTYAMLLLQQGKAREAMTASDRALALAPERGSVSELIEHRRLIEKVMRGASR